MEIMSKRKYPEKKEYIVRTISKKEMIDQLKSITSSKSCNYPSLEELFCMGSSHTVIDGIFKGRNYGSDNGKNLLSMLYEKTKLISHEKREISRGGHNSDYSFNTELHYYVFEYNNMKLNIDVFTPRSRKSTQYHCRCE